MNKLHMLDEKDRLMIDHHEDDNEESILADQHNN